jgi:tetratricopeptide (TPR) repeat protein
MKSFKYIVLGGLFLLLSSCITTAKQTQALLAAPPAELPDTHEIHNVNFVQQNSAYCGPASLSMAMAWAGEFATVDDIAKEVYTSAMRGSFQEDLIASARRHGLVAVPIKSLDALLKEVAADHPVIVLENLAVKWLPRWHYALILGYDLKKQDVIMHSGKNAYYHWDMRKFERSWMLGDYWGLVVLPAGTLAATGSEQDHLEATSGLEQAERYLEAEKSYRKILEKWPDSLVSLIALGNIAYAQGKNAEAVTWLKRAVQTHPESEEARYNLRIAEQML